MKILALDSSGLVASAAIVEDDVLIAEYTTDYKKTHSQTLLPMLDEIRQMKEASLSALNILSDIEKGDKELVKRIEKAEQQIDDMTEMFRQGQIDRMQQGRQDEEVSILYSEMLTDFERIGDHILNIGQEMGLGKVGA